VYEANFGLYKENTYNSLFSTSKAKSKST